MNVARPAPQNQIDKSCVTRTKKILDEKPEFREKWVNSTPMGRMGDPTDLMGPITFLLSDASRYMTGADLRVDGGYTIV
jgi:D-arabinitol 2-dehydrogenase